MVGPKLHSKAYIACLRHSVWFNDLNFVLSCLTLAIPGDITLTCCVSGDNVLCDRADVIMPYKSCDDEQQRPLPESPKRRIALRNHVRVQFVKTATPSCC